MTFVCYNINCYSQFRTQRGLQQHLWRSPTWKEYRLEQRIIDAAVETINASMRCQAYGVQCTRLNYEADAAVPLYTTPYEQVEFADVANDILLMAMMMIFTVTLGWLFFLYLRYRTCASIYFYMRSWNIWRQAIVKALWICNMMLNIRVSWNYSRSWRMVNSPTRCSRKFCNGHIRHMRQSLMGLTSTPKLRQGGRTLRGCTSVWNAHTSDCLTWFQQLLMTRM